MARFIIGLAFIFSLSSCKIGCVTQDAVVTNFPRMIQKTLACKNLANITRDVTSAVSSTHICSTTKAPEGPVALVVCPIAVGAIVSYAGNKIPIDWECDLELAKQGVSVALTAACNLIPL